MNNNQDMDVPSFYTVAKLLCFVLRAFSDDTCCFLVPYNWSFFSTLKNDHWPLPFGSHPLNTFMSIKELFFQPLIMASLMFFPERTFPKYLSLFVFRQLNLGYWSGQLRDRVIEPSQEFPSQVLCWAFPTRLSWFCDLSLYCRLSFHARAGGQTWQSVLTRPCLTLFCGQITLAPHHSSSTGDRFYLCHIWRVPAVALQFHSFFSSLRWMPSSPADVLVACGV